MNTDWTNTNHTDEFDFVMVTPNDLSDESYGPIKDVLLDNTTITESYYNDVRYSAKMAYVGDDWSRSSFIRIKHRVPEWDFTEVLGTYLVTNDDSTRQKGKWVTNLTLYSTLYGMKTFIAEKNWTVGRGMSIKDLFKQVCDSASRACKIDPYANDYILSSTMVFPSGKSTLSQITAIAELANDRIEVDPSGYIVLKKYVEPAKRSPSFTIDMTSIKGVAEDSVKRTSDFLRIPNHVVVEYTYNENAKEGTQNKQEQRTIIGTARVSVGSRSPKAIGYTITDYQTVNDLTPATVARANELAQAYLTADSKEDLEWEITTLYLPIHEGDVGILKLPDTTFGYSVERKVMVKSNDISLDPMSCSLTLKEVSAADVESGF